MIHIGNRIRDLLHEKRIKQSALAKQMGVNPQRISTILQQKSVTTDVLQDIMHHAGITASEIFLESVQTSTEMVGVYKQLADTQAKLIRLQEQVQDLGGNSAT